MTRTITKMYKSTPGLASNWSSCEKKSRSTLIMTPARTGVWSRLVWERRSKSPLARLDEAIEFLAKWKALRFKGGDAAFRRICKTWLRKNLGEVFPHRFRFDPKPIVELRQIKVNRLTLVSRNELHRMVDSNMTSGSPSTLLDI